ncbi:MAG: hypothetical protein ACR2NZ_07505 [Rubripirellula sp.]
MPAELNWWIGIIFSVGASLFVIGSLLTLSPAVQRALPLNPGATFFAGSIPFTIAAYLQLYQAANTPPLPDAVGQDASSTSLIGWRPADIGWWSCLLQWIGTLLFNLNTFNGMNSSLTWVQQDLWIWAPNMIGSILFMVSGYMAFAETCHRYFRWQPNSVSWWVVALNLAGCFGFLVSACLAVVLSDADSSFRMQLSVLFTLQGAIGFLLGSLAMLPEAALKESTTVLSDPDDGSHVS